MNMIKQIPNLITLGNALFGCVAIVMAFQNQYASFFYLILGAAFFDFLDGLTARALKAYSEMGKQLDSLADVISFGLAPACMLFSWMASRESFPDKEWLPFLAFVITVFSLLRLAKFNIDTRQKSSFLGLPTPANALLISSLPYLYHAYPKHLFFLDQFYFILPLIFCSACLLILPLPMFSLKFSASGKKENKNRYLFMFFCGVLIAFFHQYAVAPIIILYIVQSIVIRLIK